MSKGLREEEQLARNEKAKNDREAQAAAVAEMRKEGDVEQANLMDDWTFQ